MSVVSPRTNRILIAAAIGLMIAVCASCITETNPSAAIARGDFPAFYTMAVIAHSGEGYRLYDLEFQRQVQNTAWPSLGGTVLPAAYPAFLAFVLEPLATLTPSTARIVWIGWMLVCVALGVLLLARAIPPLRGLWWQLFVGALLFGPLFLGIVGGQIVGLSVLLYAALIALHSRAGRKSELAVGAVTGAWMFKPHFALAVVAMLVFQRRWVAVSGWLFVSALLWLVGAQVAGVNWMSAWVSFAQQFSQIDLATNAYQMTGIVPALYSVFGVGGRDSLRCLQVWEWLIVMSALVVPIALLFLVRRAGGSVEGRMRPLLLVGPLLLMCAPAVNFYDLSLGLVPLLALFRPRERRDLTLAALALVTSQAYLLSKGEGIPGVAWVYTLAIAALVSRGLHRIASNAH
jgi:hypothetical protein